MYIILLDDTFITSPLPYGNFGHPIPMLPSGKLSNFN